MRNGDGSQGLPRIPKGWRWRRVDDLAARVDRAITDGPFGSNLKTAHYTDTGPRVIRLQNIGEGEFIDAEAHISQAHFERLRAHEANAGDVVVASLGETLPRACLVPDDLGPAVVKADCPRIRVGDEMRAKFLCAALNSPPIREQAAKLIAGVGRPRLNLGKLKQLRIPTPPLAEQDRIVEAIEAYEARIGDGERSLAQARKLGTVLGQAIFDAAAARANGALHPLEDCLLEPLMNGRSVRTAQEGFPVLRLTALKKGHIDVTEAKREGHVRAVQLPVHTLIRVRVDPGVVRPDFLRLVWGPDLDEQDRIVSRASAERWSSCFVAPC